MNDTHNPASTLPAAALTERRPRFKPGTTFHTQDKRRLVCTVVDVHMTRNLAGHLVKFCYVATREFCGQQITDEHVCEVGIARNLIEEA
jgi:hypothetical protein